MTTQTDPMPGMRARRIALAIKQRRPCTLADLSEKVGYSESHLRSIENGHRAANPILAEQLADELGVTVDDLGIRVSERPPRETRRSEPSKRPEPSRPADNRPPKGDPPPKRPTKEVAA